MGTANELIVVDPVMGLPDLSKAGVSPSLTPEYLKIEELAIGAEMRCIYWGVEPRKVVDPRTGEEKMLDCACLIESIGGAPRAVISAATALVGKLRDLESTGLERGNPILVKYTKSKKGKKGNYADFSIHHLYIRGSAA